MAELATRIVPFEEGKRPKLGLALSGGGFRTAFFHIGVLLRLAELGVLKHVEVISMVSGGSIVGAAFYLRLLQKLREAEGSPLTDDDLVRLVTDLAKTFPQKVKENVRVRTFASYRLNVRMCRPDYSRSDRTAELYDRFFLEGLLEGIDPPVLMRDLGADRLPDGPAAKGQKPQLFINATSLTTGRDWRFSPVTMGEPTLEGQANDIDRVMRFQAPDSYDQLRDHVKNTPVSIAVAASAAFPGGLQPMAISEMYEGLRIQLTDGGVHDNQGIQSLISADCTHFIVSDTGGQMSSEKQARTSFLSVLLRTQKILYGRVRQEQLFRASEKSANEDAPTPLALIHLRKGEDVETIPYLPSESGEPVSGMVSSAAPPPFGIRSDVLPLLADIRTDLDSFTEVESASLMTAGYQVADEAARDPGWAGSGFLSRPTAPLDGGVLRRPLIKEYLREPTKPYLRQLKIGAKRFLKVFRLNRRIGVPFLALCLAALGAAIWRLVVSWSAGVPLGWLLVGVAVVGFSLWMPTTTWGARALDTGVATELRRVRNIILLAPIGWLWSNGYLKFFEKPFQQAGNLERLGPHPSSDQPTDNV